MLEKWQQFVMGAPQPTVLSKRAVRMLEHLTMHLSREQHGDGKIHVVRRGKLDMSYTYRSKYRPE